MAQREFELADAIQVRVLETNLLHASDVIYWLDGSTAEAVSDMTRIGYSLEVNVTQKPRAVQLLNSAGKTAFWSTPVTPMFEGRTTEADRVAPAVPNFVIAGSVVDNSGRFNPQAFSVTLGAGTGQAVVLYPAPVGVRIASGGAAQGRVVFSDSGKPLVWGLLSLRVTVGLGDPLEFKGQTDANGDFVLPLTRLPPLPLSVNEYAAELRITGLASASVEQSVNITDLVDLKLESSSVPDAFAIAIPLVIRPGEIKRIKSVNKSFIAVQIAN